jgi:hypothetical protein
MRSAVKAYRQGECGSTGGQAEKIKEVLHVGFIVGVGDGVVGLL